jgi:hypothetical protein
MSELAWNNVDLVVTTLLSFERPRKAAVCAG